MKPRSVRSRAARTAPIAALVTGLALMLAACGAPAAGDPAPASDADAPVAEAPAGEAPAGPIVIEHVQGTVELEAVPQTVYSFDWGVTQELMALGVAVDGIPKWVTPEPFAELAATAGVLDIGTVFEPDFEAIAARPADLIIIAQRSAPQQDELSRIAPTIDLTIDTADNIAQSTERLTLLGEIFGRQERAAELIAGLEASIAETAGKIADAGTGLIVLSTGGSLTAFGPGGRFGLIHDELGFAPAAAIEHDGRHGQAISFEFLLEADPDWLFVIDRDSAIQAQGEAARAVLDNEIVRRTAAYREDRIVYVDTTAWYMTGAGVVALQQVVDEVAAVLAADAG